MNSTIQTQMSTSSPLKSWVMAARPKTLSAAIVPIVASIGLVQSKGLLIQWWIVVFALYCLVFKSELIL